MPAVCRPAPEDANMEAAESLTRQPTSSLVRTLEAEDDTSQRLMAGMPILHEIDVDVNMDAHKLVALAAMPDDEGQLTQRVIDWDNKYYGTRSGNLLFFSRRTISDDSPTSGINTDSICRKRTGATHTRPS